MKKILLIFLSLIVGTLTSWAQLPEFSTTDSPVYYKINFTQGGTYLQDNGEGTFLTNANAVNSGGQLFAFIGTQNNFQLLSKLGNYVTTGYGSAINNGQSTTLLKSGTEGKNFQILNSPSQSGKFVITTTDNTSVGFNTWGGAGAEHNIGFWDTKDVNDQIQFISAEDVPDYTELEKLIPVKYTQSGTKITSWEPTNPMTLWYNIPTTLTTVSNKWMEYSLPIGNGRLGACLMGGVHTDEIQLNEKSLWTGTSTINPNPNHGKYMNLGSLYVIDESGDYSTFSNYKRWLDLEDGIGVALTLLIRTATHTHGDTSRPNLTTSSLHTIKQPKAKKSLFSSATTLGQASMQKCQSTTKGKVISQAPPTCSNITPLSVSFPLAKEPR